MKRGYFSPFFSALFVAIRKSYFAAVNEIKSTFAAVFVYVFPVCYFAIFAAVSRAYLCHKYAQITP